MNRCIQLAKNGLGTTYPNPLVGAVIVYKDTIIGEGWHYQAGQPHAEVNALQSVVNESLLEEATMYVSLEPCNHFGKTPPCADLLIAKGIKNVVIGSSDPNPKVAGKGVAKLMKAGCHVTIGVLEAECNHLNKRFFTFQNKKRPFILLKWAETMDGFIAPLQKKTTAPIWITTPQTRQLVHKTRSQEQAILVGTNTILEDNPSLTTRNWKGTSPMRIIIDRTLKISEKAAVFLNDTKTIVITEKTKEAGKNIQYETISFSDNLPQQICDIAYKEGIQSGIIEGGAATLQQFIDHSLWDECHIYIGATNFEKGIPAPTINGTLQSQWAIGTDTLTIYKN